jgi:hypothetical protein
MAQYAAKPAFAFLIAANEQPEQAARNAGHGKPAEAASAAECLARCGCEVHLASRQARRRCAWLALA